MQPTVQVEDREGGVRMLTLVNPARKNALDDRLLGLLDAALSPPPSVRAFLVRGADDTFCSGYDLTNLGPPAPDGRLPDDALMAFLSRLEEVLDTYREDPPPDRRAFDELRQRLMNLGIEEEMGLEAKADALLAEAEEREEEEEE